MNSLDGLSYVSNNLSGLHVGNFDNINSVTYQTEIPNQNILYLQGLTGNVQQQIDDLEGGSIPSDLYVTIASNESVTGQKDFAGTQLFSSIQLASSLILNSGGLTLSNLQLQKVKFLENITGDINTRLTTDETNISTALQKLTNVTFSGNTTTFAGLINMPTGTLPVNYVNGTAVNLIGQQTISGLKSFSNLITYTNNISLTTGSLLLGSGSVVLTNSTLQKIAYLANVTSDLNATFNNYVLTTTLNSTLSNYVLTTALNTALNNYVLTTALNTTLNDYVLTTALNTALNPINTDISTLNTKTQYITTSSFNTNISNNTNVDDLHVSASINGFSKSDLNNVLTECATLTSNCQTQITQAQNTANSGVSKADSAQSTANTAKSNAQAAQDTANSALALAITANTAAVGAGTLAGLAQTTASGAASGLATLNTKVDGIELDIDALQLTTTQISYSIATSRTTISQTLYSPYLEIGNLTSGFTQTVNEAIQLEGILTCKRAVNIEGTLYLENNNSMIIEGIINQNTADAGTNQFQAPITMSGIATLSGASTTISSASVQIGVNSTNTFNCNSSASFGGDVSMLASKNLRLRNIVPLLGDDVYFGEGQFNMADDVVFNMKMIANQPVQINNTFQVGTTLNRNTLTAYNTTTLLDADTSITLNSPIINITAPYVAIGQTLGFNYLFGTTFVQNLYSSSGIVGMAGQVFQQF